MHIDIKLPRYSDGEIDRAFLKEIKTGFRMEKAKEQDRLNASRKEARELKGKTHPILGKCIASFPARDYFRLVQKYGSEEVSSDEFIKRYRQDPDMRDLCPNSI